jgi:hypothetical protein
MASGELSYRVFLDDSLELAAATAAYVAVIKSGGFATLPTASGAAIHGVTKRTGAAGEEMQIFQGGIVPIVIKVASGVSAGDFVAAAPDGKFYKPSTGTGQIGVARVMVAPVANNDIVQAYIDPGVRLVF